jgi:hypothetical protein
LELGDEVFVGFLGGNPAFSGFKEDVVDPELGVSEGELRVFKTETSYRISVIGTENIEFRKRSEFKGYFNLMVLESNEGKS